MWGVLFQIFQHQNGQGWTFMSHEEICDFLGTWAVKVFPHGSDQTMLPLLMIKFKEGKARAKISFKCEVYNEQGT